jgi:phage pi2 protein 07
MSGEKIMITPQDYNELREQEIIGQEMADEKNKSIQLRKDKKKKVKMTVDGYYTDDNGFWTIYKTESGMTVMKKEKKNVH